MKTMTPICNMSCAQADTDHSARRRQAMAMSSAARGEKAGEVTILGAIVICALVIWVAKQVFG